MTCKKCGAEIEENSKFCPECGRTYSGKVKARRVTVTVIIVLLALVLPVFLFFCGLYLGRTEKDKSADTLDIVKTVSEKLRETAVIPVNIELTQDELNAILKQNSEKLLPLRNVELEFPSPGRLTVSGTIKKEDLSGSLGKSIPEIVLLFLPDELAVTVQAAPTLADGTVRAGLSSVSVAGLSLDEEALSLIGADDIVSDIVDSAISGQYGEKAELTGLEITESSTGEKVLKLKINYFLWK